MIALDKQLHFLGCFAIVAAFFATLGFVVSYMAAMILGSGAALIVGVAKEVYDSKQPKNYFSWGDIIADVAGIGAFWLLYYLGQFLQALV